MSDAPTTHSANDAGSPDFRHIDSWIFDLDNTLYPARCKLFAQIDARMGKFIQNTLGLSAEEARRVQKTYYREHGTTLNGLVRMHGIDPEAYLSYVHDIDLDVLTPQPELARILQNLPGRKFIFTNGCRHHADRVLDRLALTQIFDGIWDIRTIAYTPKPAPQSYAAMLETARIRGTRAAMFEDVARNLVPAHALGMTTVWLKNDSQWSKQGPDLPVTDAGHIHYTIDDLCHFLKTIRI